jgi:iron complex transport system permease protein
LAALFFAALFFGAVRVDALDIARWLMGGEVADGTDRILGLLRLPRAVACVLCGASLSLSGLTLQTSLNNSIVSPGIIGVNSGAGFCLVLAAVFFPFRQDIRSVAVLAGALAAALLTLLIARKAGASRLTIVLSGVCVSAFCAAGSDAAVTLVPDVIPDRTAFFIGSFSAVESGAVMAALPWMATGAAGIFLMSGRLNLFALGDEVASSLGVRVGLVRIASVLFSACLAAGAVEVCGLLSFVGLVVPHIFRRIIGHGVPFSSLCAAVMLGGAALVLGCDLAARTLFPPYELPVGIFLSLIGAPFFLYLILRKKRRITE